MESIPVDLGPSQSKKLAAAVINKTPINLRIKKSQLRGGVSITLPTKAIASIGEKATSISFDSEILEANKDFRGGVKTKKIPRLQDVQTKKPQQQDLPRFKNSGFEFHALHDEQIHDEFKDVPGHLGTYSKSNSPEDFPDLEASQSITISTGGHLVALKRIGSNCYYFDSYGCRGYGLRGACPGIRKKYGVKNIISNRRAIQPPGSTSCCFFCKDFLENVNNHRDYREWYAQWETLEENERKITEKQKLGCMGQTLPELD